MKRVLMIGSAALSFAMAGSAQAALNVCVFDLLGKAGESYKLMEEWSLNTKLWRAEVKLIPYQDEDRADRDFRQGKCDAVSMTSMRARAFNKFAGSIDALGGIPSSSIAQRAITYALDKRNAKRMISTSSGFTTEVAGISQIGLAYIFVRDKNINSIEKLRGKKFAILEYDDAQRIMVRRIGATPVNSDISDFVKKFNSGSVDVIASPAYAYKPLEIYKGLGNTGGIINLPVVNVTTDLIIRPDRFPAEFGQSSRNWFLKQSPKNFAMARRMDLDLPKKSFINLSQEETVKYQKILRDGRIELTKQGIYDPTMMSVLKKARCTVERTNFECSLPGE